MAWQPTSEVLEWIQTKFGYNSVTGMLYHTADDPGLKFVAGDEAGFLKGNGYRAVSLHNTRFGIHHRQFSVHRLAWFLHYKQWPALSIDHINLVKTDNRIDNLRLATNQQNSVNSTKRKTHNGKPCRNSSKGAYLCKKSGRWYASIKVDGRNIWLGYHDSEAAAADAYASAATQFHGEFANRG